MSDWIDPQQRQAEAAMASSTVGAGEAAAIDQGLRSHMLKVYNYMASAVMLTGIVALLFAQTEFAQNMWTEGGILPLVIIFSPLVALLIAGRNMYNKSIPSLQTFFWGFAVLMGLSMSGIFLRFSEESIAQTFFATSAAFAGLSLWGYTTKKDLSGWGSFLIMGVIGLIVASVINIFLGSETMSWVISSLGVLIFAGLTAYDTQRIKNDYLELHQMRLTEYIGKAAIVGALHLYLDFVNMFQFLLSFMGSQD